MTTTDRRYQYAGLTAVAVLFLAGPAFAQIAGGGGTGLLSQIIQWFVTNIVNGLIAAAVLFAGVLLMFSRHTLAGIAVMIVGALVISNYSTIAAMF